MKIIGNFFGNIDFGPRAFGQRSILANPFYEDTRNKINLQIKKRPWYQPLCPLILEEDRPEDAIIDFLDCNLDQLYINGYKVIKKI